MTNVQDLSVLLNEVLHLLRYRICIYIIAEKPIISKVTNPLDLPVILVYTVFVLLQNLPLVRVYSKAEK